MLNIKENHRKIYRSPKKSTNEFLNNMQEIKGKLANHAEVLEFRTKIICFFNNQLKGIKNENEKIINY